MTQEFKKLFFILISPALMVYLVLLLVGVMVFGPPVWKDNHV